MSGRGLAGAVVAALIWGAGRPGTCPAVEFIPVAGWERQLFPSYLVATATIRLPDEVAEDLQSEVADETADEPTDADAGEDPADETADEMAAAFLLGDEQGVLGVQLVAPRAGAEVTVTIRCDSICEPSTFRGTLDEADVEYAVFPTMRYRYDRLGRNKQSVPVSVTFEVEVDGERSEQTLPLTLRSINDCPFALLEGEGEVTDVSFMFAAYVNEQHPFVDKVLREALDAGLVESFTGYQSGDSGEVLRQVYSLWYALSQRDVRYSNITTSVAENPAVFSQHVRLIDESINNAQANCVDGSVLLASLLRKIDIEPVLVLVPGHCYLAFFLDAEQTELVGLETTLVGSTPDEEAEAPEELAELVDEDWAAEPSWLTFTSALGVGTAGLEENGERFADPAEVKFQMIPVAMARKMGILPIAGQGTEEFQATGTDDE